MDFYGDKTRYTNYYLTYRKSDIKYKAVYSNKQITPRQQILIDFYTQFFQSNVGGTWVEPKNEESAKNFIKAVEEYLDTPLKKDIEKVCTELGIDLNVSGYTTYELAVELLELLDMLEKERPLRKQIGQSKLDIQHYLEKLGRKPDPNKILDPISYAKELGQEITDREKVYSVFRKSYDHGIQHYKTVLYNQGVHNYYTEAMDKMKKLYGGISGIKDTTWDKVVNFPDLTHLPVDNYIPSRDKEDTSWWHRGT